MLWQIFLILTSLAQFGRFQDDELGNNPGPGTESKNPLSGCLLLSGPRIASAVNGTAYQFQVYLDRANENIVAQIWRPRKNGTDLGYYQLVGTQMFRPDRTGLNTLALDTARNGFGVRVNDRIGICIDAPVNSDNVVAFRRVPNNPVDYLSGNTIGLPQLYQVYKFGQIFTDAQFSIAVTIDRTRVEGLVGRRGQKGAKGDSGEIGPNGPPGTGLPGRNGLRGMPGSPGASGAPGPQGNTGERGLPGPAGAPGTTGQPGNPGLPGIRGDDGPKGFPGINGIPGPRGDVGPKGFPGSSIDTGVPGDTGESGQQGDEGEPGEPGGLPSYCGENDNCGNGFCQTRPWGRVCSCQKGYRWDNSQTTCVDIDECRERSNLCQHGCTNTAGDYKCDCKPGYKLSNNSLTCVFIGIPVQPVTGGSSSGLESLRSQETFIILIIWLVVLTVASILVLAIIIYRIKQVREDIKVHAQYMTQQPEIMTVEAVPALSTLDLHPATPQQYIMAPATMTESNF